MRDAATQTKPSPRNKGRAFSRCAPRARPSTRDCRPSPLCCHSLSWPHSAFPNVTRVTAVLAHSLGELLLLGTEGGHVFIVEVPGFRELEERNISLDQVASRSAAHHTALHAGGRSGSGGGVVGSGFSRVKD